MSSNTTNTGGGGYVSGDVGTEGGGFTGRDAPAQQVNLQFGDRTPKEIADILRRLQVTTYGDVEAGIRGLVREIEALRSEIKDIKTELGKVKEDMKELKEQQTDRTVTSHNMQIMLYFVLFALALLLVIAYWKW
jgi:hypothetical protein